MALRDWYIAGMLLVAVCAGASHPSRADTAGEEDAALRVAREGIARGSCPSAAARMAAPATVLPNTEAGVRQVAYARVLVQGCSRAMIVNYLVATLADGRRSVTTQIPGDTAAELRLQRDVLPFVLGAGEARAVPDCKKGAVSNTVFEGSAPPSGQTRLTQPWRETWVVEACGVRIAVPITFTPNERGTLYAIRSGEIRRLN